MTETKAVFPSLRTARLLLRPFEDADAAALHRMYQPDDVRRYLPMPTAPSLEQIQRFVTRQRAHWEKHGYGHWSLVPEGEGEIIGWAGLQYLPELDETEVAYALDRPFWGKGYATEAALASLDFGFQHFPLDHIIALVHPQNTASRRVIEKCGMAYVETLSLRGMELMRHTRPGGPKAARTTLQASLRRQDGKNAKKSACLP
ncbi:MAG TPA: GNAT family N-acetyltransferase [Anaerolineae bacterium]|nr:GNAT family N-acetyltransferase [Anaerolineae bacterium]